MRASQNFVALIETDQRFHFNNMNDSAREMLNRGAFSILRKWKDYTNENLVPKIESLCNFVKKVENSDLFVHREDRIQAYINENYVLAFLFGQKFGSPSLYNSSLTREFLTNKKWHYGDVNFVKADNICQEIDEQYDDDDYDVGLEFEIDTEDADEEQDDFLLEQDATMMEERLASAAPSMTDEIVIDYARSCFVWPVMPEYLAIIDKELSKMSEEIRKSSPGGLQILIRLLTVFSRKICPRGCVPRTIQPETAFKTANVRYNTTIDGFITITDIITGLMSPDTLIGNVMIAAANFNLPSFRNK